MYNKYYKMYFELPLKFNRLERHFLKWRRYGTLSRREQHVLDLGPCRVCNPVIKMFNTFVLFFTFIDL